MKQLERIFIVGHPGAGKGLLAKTLAEKLGWRFVDADLGLEFTIGRPLAAILGAQGVDAFYDCQLEILNALSTQKHLVVATDSSVADSGKNRQLLHNEFTVFLNVSTAVQIQRTVRNVSSLLPILNLEEFFEQLHQKRDNYFHEVAQLTIEGDKPTLEEHTNSIIQAISGSTKPLERKLILDKRDFILFHKEHHTSVHLSEQQAIYLKLLAQGKSAKEIARETDVSYRTVEGMIAMMMESLGCSSSKELIALYHAQP